VPALSGIAPALVRDPKDDYLLAAATIADADVLVTGDRDLLDIRQLLKRPAIMTAPEFLQVLESIDGPHL
jgi:predicted nucleic acid-binding protein